MSFFVKNASGQICFAAGTKHAGKTLDEVGRTDPKYLRWARRDMALWAPDSIAQEVDKAMITNGISFTVPRAKKP